MHHPPYPPTMRYRLALVGLAVLLVLPACTANRPFEEVRDGERSYTVVRPPRQTEPAPTVVVLHGGGGTAKRVQRYTGFDAVVRSDGIVVVYPEAVAGHWNDGRPIDLVDGIDDVGFLIDLIDDLVEEGLADPRQVYVLGASNGGMMTLRMICEHPDRFAAAAVVIANEPLDPTYECRGEPVPILFLHGTDDPLMPFLGGEVAAQAKEEHGFVLGAAATVDRWATANGCSGHSEETLGTDDTVTATRRSYACSAAPLEWVVLDGGGHDWPGAEQSAAREALLGSSGPIDATALIWEFFSEG